MKLLRETIRKILLENAQHYAKIVNLVMTCEPESIQQAIELGEVMGYLELLSHDESVREEYKRGSFTEKEKVSHHRWEIIPVPELLLALEEGWTNMGYDRPVFGVGMMRKDKGMFEERNGFVIYVVDKPSERK